MSDIVLLKDGLTIIPGWRDPRPDDHGKYAFIESLPEDAPPSLLRSWRPFFWDSATQSYGRTRVEWQYWTTAGWVDLTSRVCVCERPSE